MRKTPSYYKDITGQVFGHWTVGERRPNRYGTKVYHLCRCSCGVEREVCKHALMHGLTTNCGHVTKPRAMTHLEKFNTPWTEEEKERIRQWYPINGTISLSRYFNRSPDAIRAMAKKMNLKVKRVINHKKNAWSERELEILKENYPYSGVVGCIPLLPKRTKAAIWVMARNLNLYVLDELREECHGNSKRNYKMQTVIEKKAA